MSEDRTLKPTAKRRQEARQEGRVVASGSLVGAICWLGLASLVSIYGAHALVAAKQALTNFWSQSIPLTDSVMLRLVREALEGTAVFLVPLLGLILAMSVLGRVAQVGFLWAPGLVMPQMNRLASGSRLADFFSVDKLALALRGLAVFAALAISLVVALWHGHASLLSLLISRDLDNSIVHFARQWSLQIGACLFVIGLLDYAFQRYRFEVRLQMTPEELRNEIKAVQQHPQIGSGRRELRRQIQSSGERSMPSTQ